MKNADYWIAKLELLSHPEGGYYKEVFRSNEKIEANNLPERYTGPRTFYTSIYFLLKKNQLSKFHKLKSDEIWYYHAGNPVKIHTIDNKGKYHEKILGTDIEKKQSMQVIFTEGTWFAAEVIEQIYNYSLVGCMVAPGFEFEDFELADGNELVNLYPSHEDVIKNFT